MIQPASPMLGAWNCCDGLFGKQAANSSGDPEEVPLLAATAAAGGAAAGQSSGGAAMLARRRRINLHIGCPAAHGGRVPLPAVPAAVHQLMMIRVLASPRYGRTNLV
eukprot:SAG31_NODE_2702_length_5221_cov_1.495705_1_plen_107_part_00